MEQEVGSITDGEAEESEVLTGDTRQLTENPVEHWHLKGFHGFCE